MVVHCIDYIRYKSALLFRRHRPVPAGMSNANRRENERQKIKTCITIRCETDELKKLQYK